jgi:hypothetical protein
METCSSPYGNLLIYYSCVYYIMRSILPATCQSLMSQEKIGRLEKDNKVSRVQKAPEQWGEAIDQIL